MENSKNTEPSEEIELRDKKVAFYETFLGAWVENRMEMDKQILTLSSAGVGFLMWFYDKIKDQSAVWPFVLWVVAGCMFVASIVTVLCIFKENSDYIGFLLREDNQEQQKLLEKKLHNLTTWAFRLFILAISLSFTLAIMTSGYVITKQVAHGG
jgi:hypothetical protein